MKSICTLRLDHNFVEALIDEEVTVLGIADIQPETNHFRTYDTINL